MGWVPQDLSTLDCHDLLWMVGIRSPHVFGWYPRCCRARLLDHRVEYHYRPFLYNCRSTRRHMWYYRQLHWFKQRTLSESILQYDHEIRIHCRHTPLCDDIPGPRSYRDFLHRCSWSLSNMHSSLCLGRFPIHVRWHAGLLPRSYTRNGTLAKGFLLGHWLPLARRNPNCMPP